MLIIADSGSTKTDWMLVDDQNNSHHIQTSGLNPYYLTVDEIVKTLFEQALLTSIADKKNILYFYGAGCLFDDKREIISQAFHHFFSNTKVFIETDLVGAAHALCGNNSGIVCILGTGANSCFFDGKKIFQPHPSLGYILGDEGSGVFIGKQILASFLNNEMPEELRTIFQSKYNYSTEYIMNRVYHEPQANRFLASFSVFAKENINHSFILKTVYESIQSFFVYHVLPYPEHNSQPINFVGSIAYEFSEIIKEIGSRLNLEIGKIIQKPIESLTEFHLSDQNN